jgi:hypothetical protein
LDYINAAPFYEPPEATALGPLLVTLEFPYFETIRLFDSDPPDRTRALIETLLRSARGGTSRYCTDAVGSRLQWPKLGAMIPEE